MTSSILEIRLLEVIFLQPHQNITIDGVPTQVVENHRLQGHARNAGIEGFDYHQAITSLILGGKIRRITSEFSLGSYTEKCHYLTITEKGLEALN